MMNPSLAEGAAQRCRKEFLPVSNGAVLGAICVPGDEQPWVRIAVQHLHSDIKALCRQNLPELDALPCDEDSPPCIMLIGTLGNKAVDDIANSSGLDTTRIRGRREAFMIQRVPPGSSCPPHILFLLGSDSFGTRRAIYALCEKLGMDPMYPFTGFVPPYKPELNINDYRQPYIGETPPVRWRGVFINDEERIKMWLSEDPVNLPPELFEKLFETVVRSDANMLAPPMWYTDYMDEATRQRCHDYGIYYTASHMEMLLFNPQCPQRPGHWPDPDEEPFDYTINADKMDECWRESVRRHKGMLSVWPLGIRDAVDAGMVNKVSLEEQAEITQKALEHQLRVLEEELGETPHPEKDPTTITLYKEVLEIYETKKLPIPRETIVVWPDDNYGHMRRLPNDSEMRKNPRNGVYYHAGYCRNQGTPWVSARLMSSELGGAIRAGCRDFVLVNVSDGREFVHGWRAAMSLCTRPGMLSLSPEEFGCNFDKRFWATYVGEHHAPETAIIWNRLVELIYRRLPYWHMLHATQTLDAMRKHLKENPADQFMPPRPTNRDCETGPPFSDEEWDAYSDALAELGKDIRSIRKRIPKHGKQLFHDQLVVYYVVTECVDRWSRLIIEAGRALADADCEKAYAKLEQAVGVLIPVDEAREKAAWGEFENWYRGEWHDLYVRGAIPSDHPDWSLVPARCDRDIDEAMSLLK